MRAKAKLTLTVYYENLKNSSPEEIVETAKRNLENLVSRSVNRGELTSDEGPMTVETYDYDIDVVPYESDS